MRTRTSSERLTTPESKFLTPANEIRNGVEVVRFHF